LSVESAALMKGGHIFLSLSQNSSGPKKSGKQRKRI